MFRVKRGDTLISTIEQEYGLELNSRSDKTLSNLLEERGFESLTSLVNAYHGRATEFSRKRRLFLSFDADDKAQVHGFRLMALNPSVDIDFSETSLRTPINSQNGTYLKQELRKKIERASVLVCLIGNATAWSQWVDWEVRMARHLGKGVCGLRLKDSRGRTPPSLVEITAPVSGWDTAGMIAVIESAAARRS